MKTILLGVVAMLAAVPAAAQYQERVHTAEGAFDTKIDDRNVEPIYFGQIGYVDQVQVPWRSVSPGKWNRESDPAFRKDNYSLAASADYDADGKADTAKIYTNGQQTAVIITFGSAGKAPLVAFKTDGVEAGMEIRGQGNRFLVSIPEVGYKILAQHKGKPVVVTVGD